MTTARTMARLRRLEKFIEPAPLDLFPPLPADVSVTLAAIASIRAILIRLSEIDRKRWYCPDDPRSEITAEEIEEEARLKMVALQEMQALGFPEGYGQHHYEQDKELLRRVEPSEINPRPLKLTDREEESKEFIHERINGLYEAGPRYRAHQRVDEIIFGNDPLGSTMLEEHQKDHLRELHPPKRELTGLYPKISAFLAPPDGIYKRRKERLDEWHSKKGQDPRTFPSCCPWQRHPYSPYTLERQNQQFVEMGFPAEAPRPGRMTKEEFDAKNREREEKRKAYVPDPNPLWSRAAIARATSAQIQCHPPLRKIILPF